MKVENRQVEKGSSHPSHSGHDVCPVCGSQYSFTTNEKVSNEIRLYEMYRHKKDGVVYYHKLEYGEI